MKLYIAEKPSMASEIANCLGIEKRENGFIKVKTSDYITWCFGHILRQKNPDEYNSKYKIWNQDDLPIIPNKWELVIADKCKTQLNIIKKLISSADEIINAGDPDREGQLLIDEVLEFLGNKKQVKRLLLNALDEKSIKYALNNLQDNNKFVGLKNSALARSRADWLIGMNFSRAYTLKMRQSGINDVINIGRVKTPTMSLVARRENEIKNFNPTTHFKLEVLWKYENDLIKSKWQPKNDCPYLNENGYITKLKCINDIENKIQNVIGKVKDVQTETVSEPARLPYSLSSLQIEAGKKYNYSPQEVLNAAQNLYEKKLTTYPRSDCNYLPTNQFNDARNIMDGLVRIGTLSPFAKKADLSLKNRSWNDKKITAHHAIIPTQVHCDLNTLSEIERNIYCLIGQVYIAQFLPNYIYNKTKLIIEAVEENFIANGRAIKQIGWRAIYKDDENEKNDNIMLPAAGKNDRLQYNSSECITLITKPPKRFTPATLLQAMKEIYKFVSDKNLKDKLKSVSGIGTEATRAKIIDDLIAKNFIQLNKKELHPTELAQGLIKILPDSIIYPDRTAIWEDKLDQIAEQKLDYQKFVQEQIGYVIKTLKDIKEIQIKMPQTVFKCPECGNALLRRKSKNGYFWSCSTYPKCQAAFPDIKSKPAIYKCPKCKVGYLRRIKSKSGKGYFWSCNKYPNCKTIYEDEKGIPNIKK